MNEHRNDEVMPEFRYRGARALVALHEEHLTHFLDVWKRAKASGTSLPEIDDPDYASFDALLGHVFRWARTYINWICEQLELPDPGVKPVPDVDVIASDAGDYLQHVLDKWSTPLRNVPQERFYDQVYAAPWGVPYSIGAMLEHAAVHPVLHSFQLEELMGERTSFLQEF